MGKAQRKVRNQLTVADKLLVLQMAEKKESQRKIDFKFGISKTQVQQILRNKETLKENVESGLLSLQA